MRLAKGCVIAVLMIVFVSPSVFAQNKQTEEPRPLSQSVVLVLKLVSRTHVKPTTGIVISDDGLVLVPAQLVTDPGEIVVLDNGVDIAVNGRPAVIVDKPHSGGLALISVEGLKRPAITLSANALDDDQSLHLETFPPAKFMAKGAQPLWVPVKLAQPNANMRVAVSAETPLPYVTGPIIDDCGYFAGLSLAIGPSSMDLDKLPIVVFTDELQQIFEAMQVNLRSVRCQGSTQPQPEPASIAEEPHQATGTQSQIEGSAEPEVVIDQVEPTDEKHSGNGNPAQAAPLNTTAQSTSILKDIPPWLILIAVFVVVVLIWKRIRLLRISSGRNKMESAKASVTTRPSASEEPDTDQVAVNSGGFDQRPRSAPLNELEIPDLNALPAGCNAVLVVEGNFDETNAFKRYCAVDSEYIDICFGRGDVDISIEHPTISRRHARLVSKASSMTFSDLGSSNGTFINDTPCLPGEIMYISTDDELQLGQIGMRIRIVSKQAELT